MILIPPSSETIVKRLLPGFERKNPGPWHFIREDKDRKCICGELLSGIYDVETSKLGEAAGKMCARCWPFQVQKAGKP